MVSDKIRVFCVDDNSLVTDALRLQLGRAKDIQWAGSAHDADGLLNHAMKECPGVVLLDIDMPGKDPFEAIGDLGTLCHESRVLMYSGLLKRELVDRAIDAGAWGFVAKTDGEQELLDSIRTVASGAIAFSQSIRSMFGES